MTWTPKTQQSETWTAHTQEIRPFDPYGFSQTPDFDTGSTAGVWNDSAQQAEVWTPQ